MGIEPVLAIAAAVVLFGVAINLSGRGAEVLGGLFSRPGALGWPRGVQEDDDLRWSWQSRPDAGDEEPGWDELGPGAGPRADRVAYLPRSARARS